MHLVDIDFAGIETVDWTGLDSVGIEIGMVAFVVVASAAVASVVVASVAVASVVAASVVAVFVIVDMLHIEVVEYNCPHFDLDCKLDSDYEVGMAVLRVALHSTSGSAVAGRIDFRTFQFLLLICTSNGM